EKSGSNTWAKQLTRWRRRSTTTGSTSLAAMRISTAQTLRLVAADAGAILQRAHPPNQVGQTRQRCRVAPVLAHVHRRAAPDDRVVSQAAVDAGLRGDHDAVADRRVVGASYLSAEQAPFADSRRARDSRLAREAR